MAMRPHFIMVFAVLAVVSHSTAYSQVFEYKDGRKLEIEFVQEPPCPVKISVRNVDLKAEPDKHLITLEVVNESKKPIRAFAMVSGGNRHPNMHTRTFAGTPFEAGQKLIHVVWPNSQEHYYFFFDYVLFDDGSTCGWNNHHRSIQIAKYLESRAAAIVRLKELALIYLDPDEIIASLDKAAAPGFISFDNPGPPNPETIKSMPGVAWGHLVIQLHQLKERQKEARELAAQLEKEMPR